MGEFWQPSIAISFSLTKLSVPKRSTLSGNEVWIPEVEPLARGHAATPSNDVAKMQNIAPSTLN